MSTIVLGDSGMLGSMVKRVLECDGIHRPYFNAEAEFHLFDRYDRIVNCVGVIKPYCDDIKRAVKVNAYFPHILPVKTIQIATDCVYSGQIGNYVETDPHDALDVYGKTKSLGEAPHLINLRCSIIGPEKKNHISLLDWFLSQDKANGFTNHFWNGITTYHFAKICQGNIDNDLELPMLQHIVPADVVTKAELLRIIAKAYKRDIVVTDTVAPETVDRTLSTNEPDINLLLWKAAGYDQPPTIKQMIEELAAYDTK